MTNQDINIINYEIYNSAKNNQIENEKLHSNQIYGKIDNNKEEVKKKTTKHIIDLGKKSEIKSEKSQDYEISVYDDNFDDNDNDLDIINSVLNQKNSYQNSISNKGSIRRGKENEKIMNYSEEIIELKEDENNSPSKEMNNSRYIYKTKKRNDRNDSNNRSKGYTGRKRGRKRKIITLYSEDNTNINEIDDEDIKIVSKENKFMIKFGDALSHDSGKIIEPNEKIQTSSIFSNINNYSNKLFLVIRPNKGLNNELENNINMNKIEYRL